VSLTTRTHSQGLYGIKTPNNDKHSPSTDEHWLCFDLNVKAAVYVLYDRRATDQPRWLKDDFKDQDISAVSHTDKNMGYFEMYYSIRSVGFPVCTDRWPVDRAGDADTHEDSIPQGPRHSLPWR
jgi:hypothetical protein